MPYRRKKLTFAISSPDEFLLEMMMKVAEQEYRRMKSELALRSRKVAPFDVFSAFCTLCN